MKFYRLGIIVNLSFLFLATFVSVSHAQTTQVMTGKVNNDLSVTLDWSLPLDTNQYGDVNVSVPTDVGMKAINYIFVSAYDSQGSVQTTNTGSGVYNLRFNRTNLGVQGMHSIFNVPPAYISPAFIGYDFTPETDTLFLKSPTLDLTYPSSLQLIDTKPEYTGTNPLHIAYPNDPNAGIFEINFLRTPLPSGYTTIDQGIFTLVGKQADVTRLKKLVTPLTFIPDSFKKVLGVFDLDHVYIIVADFSGQGKFQSELGGFRRSNNIIIFDPSNFTSGADDTLLREMIIHELAHSVIYRNTYHKEEKFSPWFDEGMAVFMEHELGENKLNDSNYYVAPDSSGKLEVYQDLYLWFSETQLLARYKANQFDFDSPAGGIDAVNDFYAHAGLVFAHFYSIVGDQGMRTFMQRLNQLYSCGMVKNMCDTNKILAVMSDISGLNRDQILFPYRDDQNFTQKIQPFVRNKLTQDQINGILAKYPSDKVSHVSNPIGDITDTKNTSKTTTYGQENVSKTQDTSTSILGGIVIVVGIVILGIVAMLTFRLIRWILQKNRKN